MLGCFRFCYFDPVSAVPEFWAPKDRFVPVHGCCMQAFFSGHFFSLRGEKFEWSYGSSKQLPSFFKPDTRAWQATPFFDGLWPHDSSFLGSKITGPDHPPFLGQEDLVACLLYSSLFLEDAIFQPKGRKIRMNSWIAIYTGPATLFFLTDQNLSFLGVGVGGVCWPAPFMW